MQLKFFIPVLKKLKRWLSMCQLAWQIHTSPGFKVRKRKDGVYLGCMNIIKLGDEKFNVLYGGIRMWTKKDERDKYEFFLKKILDNGGMPAFQSKADEVFSSINDETFGILKRDKYGFDFYDSNGRLFPKNSDLFDANNTIIARLEGKEIETFIFFHKQSVYQKRKLLDEIVRSKLLESRNVYDPSAIGKIQGEIVPASIRGLGPDFNQPHLEKFIYQQDLKYANIPIRMSGSYSEDFRRAFQAAGIDTSDPALVDFVWHHLDDIKFDPDGVASCTGQLVSKYLHDQIVARSLKLLGEPIEDTIIAGRHIGSVSPWEGLHMVPYK